VDAALGWIGELARWLSAWVPRLVHVLAYQRAIKFVRDHTEEIGPGLHLYWPITTQVEAKAVCRQVLNLASQTLVTKDGKTVAASGVVVYEITDLHRFLVENFDAEQSLGDSPRCASP
jgi:regulator of protease activity HflC (stomatin/prohibitin superfamily)